MSPAITLPESLDLSHHLNKRVRAAPPSAMKAMGRLVKDKKNLLSLGGGLPHASLFPMQHATFTLPTLEAIATGDVQSWVDGTAATEQIHLKKTGKGTEDDEGGILDLNDVLQYGLANGFSEFIGQLSELNELLHGKTISDASVYITCGNTDGVSKVFQLFVEPDVTNVLAEEFTFASSLNSGRSKGAKFYPVKVDGDGLVPEDLDRVLSTWDEDALGQKPKLLYTIPCGQNPTGSIQPQSRYDEIYRIAQKHDVIIMEDDPYFPLQYRPYEADKQKREEQLAAARAEMPPLSSDGSDDSQAVAKAFNDYAGVRSYLSRDTDGRVVRIDTFSKVYGPGIRSGWVSANSLFVDRLLRIGETSTQTPNNLGQAVLASYLSPKHWGVSGFIRWMWAVRLEYQAKRDVFLDALAKYAPVDLVSTVPCGGGMFQWLRIEVSKHPRYARTPIQTGAAELKIDSTPEEAEVVSGLHPKRSEGESAEAYTTNTSELIDELWRYLLDEHDVLVMPAKLFQVEKPGVDQTDRLNYFRATFAGDREDIEKALKALGKGVEEWFARG